MDDVANIGRRKRPLADRVRGWPWSGEGTGGARRGDNFVVHGYSEAVPLPIRPSTFSRDGAKGLSDRAIPPSRKLRCGPLRVVDAILGGLGAHGCPKVLLLSQHVAVVCFSLVELVHAHQQLLLLQVLLMHLLMQLLMQLRRGVGRANRCRAWPRRRGVGRITDAVRKVVTDLGVLTRRRVGDLSGIPHHQVDGLLVVCPDLQHTYISQRPVGNPTAYKEKPTDSSPKMSCSVSVSRERSRPRWIRRWWSSAGRDGRSSRIFSLSCCTVVVAGSPGNLGFPTPAEGETI